MKLCGIYCVISALNLFYLNYVLRFTSRLSYQQSFFISRIFVTHVPIQCWVFGQITVPREFAKVRVDPGGLWWNLPSLPQKKSPWTQAEQNFIHTKSAGFKRTDLTCSPKSTWISKKNGRVQADLRGLASGRRYTYFIPPSQICPAWVRTDLADKILICLSPWRNFLRRTQRIPPGSTRI